MCRAKTCHCHVLGRRVSLVFALVVVFQFVFTQRGFLVAAQSNVTGLAMDGPCATSALGPCNHSAAHFVIGGLLPLHQLHSGTAKPSACTDPGALVSFFTEALQWTEAFRHAVDLVNADPDLLPGLTLGYRMRDTCLNAQESLRQSLAFLGSDYCRVNDTQVSTTGGGSGGGPTPLAARVAGVLGPYTSSESISVTDLMDLFEVPVVSFAATSPQLSDKTRFPLFLRTTPNDNFTSRAVVQLARSLNWTFVNVINTDDDFGIAGAAAVVREFKTADNGSGTASCVGTEASENRRSLSSRPTTREAVDAWRFMLNKSPQNKSNVAVLFVQRSGAQELFRTGMEDPEIREAAQQRNLTFVGVGAWGGVSEAVSPGLSLAKGSVSVIASGEPVRVFDEHFGSLHPSKTKDNPWLVEGWESIFNCSLNDPKCANNNLTNPAYYTQSSKVPFIYNAVFAFAHAFHDIYDKDCGRVAKGCRSLTNATRAVQALRDVTFKTVTGNTFRFNKMGDPVEAMYTVLNTAVDEINQVVQFPTVGRYLVRFSPSNLTECERRQNTRYVDGNCIEEILTVNLEQVVWNSGQSEVPQSRCSADCSPGSKQNVNSKTACCWTCSACAGHSYSAGVNAQACTECADNEVTAGKTGCKHVRVVEFSVSEPYAAAGIIPATISIVAVIACLLWVIVRRHDSFFPLGLEPTVACLSGFLMIYSGLFVQLGGPTAVACELQLAMFSIGFCVVVANILTYLHYRLCVVTSRPLAAFLLNSCRRAVVSLLAVLPPALIILFAVMISPPEVSSKVTKHEKEERECTNNGLDSFLLPLYNDVLLLVCMAIGTYTLRKERHKEMVYEVDVRPRVLFFATAGALITFICNIVYIILIQILTAGPIAKAGVEHILVWVSSSSLFVIIFTQQLRQLGPLRRTEEKWLNALHKTLQDRSAHSKLWRINSAGNNSEESHGADKARESSDKETSNRISKYGVYLKVSISQLGQFGKTAGEEDTQRHDAGHFIGGAEAAAASEEVTVRPLSIFGTPQAGNGEGLDGGASGRSSAHLLPAMPQMANI